MGWRLIGDKTSEEVDLEQRGDINALQRYRFVLHWNKYRTRPPSSSRKLLFVEEDLREVVQEEISIKEGLDALSKDAKEKLDALNVKYRLLEQLCYGDPILNGICTVCLLKIVLADKDAVLVNVAAVLIVRPRVHLELDIVQLNVGAVVELEALTFLKKTRDY
ncbi:hypothetical protein ACN42_g4916 [Penicillium freii]|uniref:Uncharacterized protein n=1 Tax=Penicillium freii TaxID=48697 RepID=A0A101MKE6_PENFR|nr:hypothetical protein ACN42_g4916 [Penicillium freii]